MVYSLITWFLWVMFSSDEKPNRKNNSQLETRRVTCAQRQPSLKGHVQTHHNPLDTSSHTDVLLVQSYYMCVSKMISLHRENV